MKDISEFGYSNTLSPDQLTVLPGQFKIYLDAVNINLYQQDPHLVTYRIFPAGMGPHLVPSSIYDHFIYIRQEWFPCAVYSLLSVRAFRKKEKHIHFP